LLCADRAFAQSQIHTGTQFDALVFNASTVFFDNGRKVDFRTFVGGETFFASRTLTAAANQVAIFSQTSLHHLGVGMAAEGALHL
jgi:hypothetical protein